MPSAETEAAVASGVNVFKTIMGIFILASVLYGVAGVLKRQELPGPPTLWQQLW